ncbi:MAG: hypothetical protein ABJE66_34855 [Deltaproteobacteria bacterium]
MKLVWILGLAACGGSSATTGPAKPAAGDKQCAWHDEVVGKAESLQQTWVALPNALAHAGVNATGAALIGLDGKPLGAAATANPPLDAATVINAGALIKGYFAFVTGTAGGKPTAELARFDATGAATGTADEMMAFPPELGAEAGKQLIEAGNCFALLTDKDVRMADGHGKPVGAPIAHGTPVRVTRVGDVKSFRIAVQWDATKLQVFDASTGDPIGDAVDTGHDLIALVPMGATSALAIAAKDGLLEDAVVGNDGKVGAWHTLHEGHRADNVIAGEQPGGTMLVQFTDDQAYAGQIHADGSLGPLSAPGPADHQSTFGIVGFDGIYDQDGTDIRRWTCD